MGISGLLAFNKLIRLLRFGLYSCVFFGLIFYISTNRVILPQLITGFLFGVLIGLLEELTYHRKIVGLSLPKRYLLGTAFFTIRITSVAIRGITDAPPSPRSIWILS
ncbi:MAG: hypothetical protein U5K79_07870 [Cyclobacteriaceae bacterium]|nr:hypothetical protein [Cyclobacteriaceae bacterium]